MTKSGKHCGKRRNCHYVFKKPSAAEAPEGVYMRKMVKRRGIQNYILKTKVHHMGGSLNIIQL